MTGLRVILDQIAAPIPGGIGRYARELTLALIETAPHGAEVSGFIPSSPESEYDRLRSLLPGLSGLEKSALDRRQIAAAWQHGFTRMRGQRFTHAPSLLAPLYRHDRVNNPYEQVVVTIHDAVPWTHPETLTPRGVSWHRAMAKRAERYADAVVVPTHAVADELKQFLSLGDRVRIISGAVSADLTPPRDAAQRRARHGLPENYIVSVGTLEPRKGVPTTVRALSHLADLDLHLVIIGPSGWGGLHIDDVVGASEVDVRRVHALGVVDDDDLAAVVAGARAYVMASLAEGFGLPLLEAMSMSTPTVHTDVPALIEVADGAGEVVVRSDDQERVAEAIAQSVRDIIGDDRHAERLRLRGLDRVRAFSWRDSAEKTWQLHADL